MVSRWQWVHIDFARPVCGKMYVVMMDSHSKWPEVWKMNSTNTTKIIEILRQVFAVFCLLEQIMSDNGPQFVSHGFSRFMRNNVIKHFRSVAYRKIYTNL